MVCGGRISGVIAVDCGIAILANGLRESTQRALLVAMIHPEPDAKRGSGGRVKSSVSEDFPMVHPGTLARYSPLETPLRQRSSFHARLSPALDGSLGGCVAGRSCVAHGGTYE